MPWHLFSNNKATTSTQLAKEVSKFARLGSVQNGLPGAMRALPVAAIVAGNAYAKMLDKDGPELLGGNVIERTMLGSDQKDESVMVLEAPSQKMEDGAKGDGEGGELIRQGDGVDAVVKSMGLTETEATIPTIVLKRRTTGEGKP